MNNEIYNDSRLIEIFDSYSPAGIKAGTAIKETAENAANSEIIVPVLGLQGMGKSTLINAILAEDIMPSLPSAVTTKPL